MRATSDITSPNRGKYIWICSFHQPHSDTIAAGTSVCSMDTIWNNESRSVTWKACTTEKSSPSIWYNPYNLLIRFCFFNCVKIENSIVAVWRRVACSYLLAKILPKQLLHQFFSQHQGNYCIWGSSVINVAVNKEQHVKKSALFSDKPSEAEYRATYIQKRVWGNKEQGLGLPGKKKKKKEKKGQQFMWVVSATHYYLDYYLL